jgi:hypothetical protein
LKLQLVVLEAVLSDWQICDFKLDLISLWNTTSFWCDGDILVNLPFPDEVKVEVSTVLEDHSLILSFVYEEVSEIELMRFTREHFHSA